MSHFIDVCSLMDIAPDTGVCALVNGVQVAIFRPVASKTVYAVNNFDPIGRANVLSRGIISEINGELTVASPLYKQHYVLTTGKCLEEDVSIATYQTCIKDNRVFVQA